MQHFGYIDLTTGNGCVAQLVERSLPIPEVHGSNPVIGKNLFILNICLLSNEDGREWPIFKKKQAMTDCMGQLKKHWHLGVDSISMCAVFDSTAS